MTSNSKIPVILDTDIGTDIDDCWALALLLRCPELDLKMVLTGTGDTRFRARVAAKMLEAAGRSDIPIGIGKPFPEETNNVQEGWVEDYPLSRWKGPLHEDGIGAMLSLLKTLPPKPVILAIGPAANFGEMLDREPQLGKAASLVGMFGSVDVGYGGAPEPVAEYNVRVHTLNCRRAFEAFEKVTITPVDTCGLVTLKGEPWQRMLASKDPLTLALLGAYRQWAGVVPWAKGINPGIESSALFDTVAAWLCFDEQWVQMEEIGIEVTDDGRTLRNAAKKKLRVATKWKDMKAFEEFLIRRMGGKT